MLADVPAIYTQRLELVSMGAAFLRAVLARDIATAEGEIGAAIPPDLPDRLGVFVTNRLAQLEADPSIQRWLARAMVVTDGDGRRQLIGAIGFHGAPDDQGRLEVGYRIEPEYRRRGFTREAVCGMFDWAAAEGGIHRFIASVRPDNEASLGLVRSLGFVQTGTQIDEIDGLELVHEATWPRPEVLGRSA